MDWIDRLYTLLYNMIAILILDALQHVAIQLLGYLHLTKHPQASIIHIATWLLLTLLYMTKQNSTTNQQSQQLR